MSENNLNSKRAAEEEYEIDLLAVFNAIMKKLPLVIIVTVLCGALAFAGTYFFIKPQYQTSFTVYVNNKSDSGETTALSSSDISAARSLASTYAEIISGRTVLTDAASKCGLDSLSYKQLSGFVDAETSSTTEIITVSVRGLSPENALYLAQSIAQVAEGQISQIVDGSSMRVVDEPYLPTGIYSPNYVKNTAIGAILGLLAVCGIIALKEIIDDRVKDQDALESKLGIPVLGTIPDFESAERKSHGYYGYGKRSSDSEKSSEKPAKAAKTPRASKTEKQSKADIMSVKKPVAGDSEKGGKQ